MLLRFGFRDLISRLSLMLNSKSDFAVEMILKSASSGFCPMQGSHQSWNVMEFTLNSGKKYGGEKVMESHGILKNLKPKNEFSYLL